MPTIINAKAILYRNDRPQSLAANTNGFQDHWNLSFGSYKYGYWFGASRPKPTGLFSAIAFGKTSTLSSK